MNDRDHEEPRFEQPVRDLPAISRRRPLPRDEVWLRAWCSFAPDSGMLGSRSANATRHADECLAAFDKRFPTDI